MPRRNNYQHQKDWRARYPDKYREDRKRRAARVKRKPRQNSRWTSVEKKLLFTFEGTDLELANKLGRSMQAIQNARHYLSTQDMMDNIVRSDTSEKQPVRRRKAKPTKRPRLKRRKAPKNTLG